MEALEELSERVAKYRTIVLVISTLQLYGRWICVQRAFATLED
jgi:hypothetical protein